MPQRVQRLTAAQRTGLQPPTPRQDIPELQPRGPIGSLLQAQATVGNRTVLRMLGRAAPVLERAPRSSGPDSSTESKPAIGHPLDVLELDADRVADEVTRPVLRPLDGDGTPAPLHHAAAAHGLSTTIQRKPDQDAETTTGWADMARKARAARASGDMKQAESLYRQAIAAAAAGATFPKGLTKSVPTPDQIRLDFKLTDHAETRGPEVPASPTDYWRWVFFGPDSILDTVAHTRVVVTHELVHVRQYAELWSAYEQEPRASRPSWSEYIKPQSRRERVEGPEELEAEITSLDALPQLSREELRLALRGLLVAHVRTSVYTPAKGERVAVTTAVSGPQILAAFQRADAKLQDAMGAELWWSLIKVDPSKDRWRTVLRELQPLAVKGYADATFRPFYDQFLADKDLKFADIIGDTKKGQQLQRFAVSAARPEEVPPVVDEVLRSPGQALDDTTRAAMQTRFGFDFSQVRVHTDARAAASARAVNALAYTVGRDVVFAEGHYAPGTPTGAHLLAHELTHVVQQRGTGTPPIQRAPADGKKTKTPPAKTPPAKTPPAKTPPAKTPPAKTPPATSKVKKVTVTKQGPGYDDFEAKRGAGTALGYHHGWHGGSWFANFRFLVTVDVDGDINTCTYEQTLDMTTTFRTSSGDDTYDELKNRPLRTEEWVKVSGSTVQWQDAPGVISTAGRKKADLPYSFKGSFTQSATGADGERVGVAWKVEYELGTDDNWKKQTDELDKSATHS